MIERLGSGIRAGRLFAFESPLRGDKNTASELDGAARHGDAIRGLPRRTVGGSARGAGAATETAGWCAARRPPGPGRGVVSVIPVDGLRYTANLRWLERVGRRGTVRTAERLERHWFVHRGKHTGFADLDASGCPDGLRALSLALMTLIGGGRWVALVEGDATGGDTLCSIGEGAGRRDPRQRRRRVQRPGGGTESPRAVTVAGLGAACDAGTRGHALRNGESEIAELDPDFGK